MSKELQADTKVTFNAIRFDETSKMRVVIPKENWEIAAEDADYIYLARPARLGLQYGLPTISKKDDKDD